MRREDVASDLSLLAFEFFYWFSRFEFALKENGYLKSHKIGSNAEPGWEDFVDKWHSVYSLSAEAQVLLAASPERQIISARGALGWAPVNLNECQSELGRVVRLVKTVRNNLFHGGKHGSAGWDDPKRTATLLSSGVAVLRQFAELAEIEADFVRSY